MLGSDEDAVTCWCRIENEKEPENLNYYIGIDYAAWCVTKTAGHSAEQRPSYLLPDRHVRGTRTLFTGSFPDGNYACK